jgi:Cu-Zn family superoxide dismutase
MVLFCNSGHIHCLTAKEIEMNKRLFAAGAVLALGMMTVGCAENNDGAANKAAPAARKLADAATAVCMIEPTKGNNVKGEVKFTEANGKVTVVADLSGLEPNSKHGFHIHAGTECGDDGMKAGGHFNPDNHQHGLPNAAQHHAGDFGNIEADKDGKAHVELTVDDITINGAKNAVAGHAMIVHAKADDGSQPVGNAGARIACGIIKASEQK